MKDAAILAREYPVTLRMENEDGRECYYAYADAFPGIMGDGDTADEAMADLREVLSDVIQARLDEGIALPSAHPPEARFSGKLSLRLARSAHRMIAERARVDGISINQWITNAIMIRLGAETRPAEGDERTRFSVQTGARPSKYDGREQGQRD